MVRPLRNALAVVVSAAMVVGTGPPAAAELPHPADGRQGTGPASLHTVTLITGDVVQLSTFADGRQSAAVPDAGRHGYQLSEQDGDVYVMPTEALPYVASGQVDRALFNITDLVADGYHDAASKTIPLLVTGAPESPGARAVAPATPSGAKRERVLSSIGAVAVEEDKATARAFWDAITTGPTTLSTGVRKIWLDRKARATLSDSVPQIGAPTAWKAGYDGTGVKVAVLDTGYDPTHPALAGRVADAANFTPEADAVDRHGHGTHVASTVAGQDVSKPSGQGVAPGAQLLVGKVMDANGVGEISWIIAGMEWAVSQGARVVNMSLGAPAVEGPDPYTEAVDSLTRSSGALFVVSAGNAGPGMQTLGSPGTASTALTVGAVSRKNELADFSSRGPRLGDGAAKPEITAPGVGIVAARAAGTSMGTPVNDFYTASSGTSMAAPHVAGAAALLAQQHPDWRADQLKAALVTSAHEMRGEPVWAQGAGRVDVAAALRQQVTADTATVSFGKVPAGSDARTADVTYHNVGKHPVTLNLSVRANEVGATTRPAALSVSPARLKIPAGGHATASVRLDVAATAPNLYAGLLAARGGGQEIRIPVGLNLTPPMRTLRIEAVDRKGAAAQGFVNRTVLWNLDTGETSYGFFLAGGATVELPAGRYAMMAHIYTPGSDNLPEDVTLLGEPELVLDRDRTLHLDARTGNEIRVDTPQRTQRSRLGLSWQRTTARGSILTGESLGEWLRAYAAPTRPVSIGTFKFFSRWTLDAPTLTTAEITGAGGFPLESPQALDRTPQLDGEWTGRLVDGGAGTPEELAAAGARGAAVLLRWNGEGNDAQLTAATEAGARVVFLTPPDETFSHWNMVGGGWPWFAPTYAVSYPEAARMRERIAAGPTTIALAGHAHSPYRYELLLTEPDAVPADPHYRADDLGLATVRSEFHQHGVLMQSMEQRAGYPDGINTAFAFVRAVHGGHQRTTYVNTGGVAWRASAAADGRNAMGFKGLMFGPLMTYKPGQRTGEVWFPALTRPALPDAIPDYEAGVPVNRADDAIRVAVPQYVDGAVGQYGWVDHFSDRSELTLRRGDTVLGSTDRSTHVFEVPADKGEYQLTLNVKRDHFNDGGHFPPPIDDLAWWTTSTETSTTWTFRSGRPTKDEPAVLPLVQVGYDIETDLFNAVRADQPYPLVLTPGYQPGAKGPGRFDISVSVSYDDGATWSGAPVGGKKKVTATIPPAPDGAQFATIRVDADDADGNRIEQTIVRAWKVAQ